MSVLRLLLSALLLTSLLGGCASYKLGSPGTLPFRTLHVALAEDRSYTPQVRALLTAQIIEELNRSGRVQVVADANAAEARLRITLTEVQRETSVTQANDSGRPLKLERRFTARLRLQDAAGKQLWLDDAEVSTDRFVLLLPGSGLANAEFAELPVATRALAQETARAVLGVW